MQDLIEKMSQHSASDIESLYRCSPCQLELNGHLLASKSWEFSVTIIWIYIDILYNTMVVTLSTLIYYGSSKLLPRSPLHLQLSSCSPLWAVKSLRDDLWKQAHVMKSDSDGSVAKSNPNSSLCLSLSQWTTSDSEKSPKVSEQIERGGGSLVRSSFDCITCAWMLRGGSHLDNEG